MDRQQDLYFYSPKIKNAFIVLLTTGFLVFSVLVGGYAFNLGDYFIGALGVLLTLVFSFATYAGLKRVFLSKPYLILTEEELIIGASSKNAVPLQWEDIIGYDVRSVSFNKLIEIMLDDEGKYRRRMSTLARWNNTMNDVMNFRPFAIAWKQVKRKDRNKLARALDERAFGIKGQLHELYESVDADTVERVFHSQDRLREQMKADKEEQKERSQVNGKYLLQSYGISLLLTAGAFLMFYWSGESDDNNTFLLIFCFILYPYAKVIWDVLVGFKLRYKADKDETSFLYRLVLFIHILLYLFSVVLAPLGFLYFIIRAIRRKINEKKIGEESYVDSERVLPDDEALGKFDAPIKIPFSVRFAIFALHIFLVQVLAFIFINTEIEDFFVLAVLIMYGLTFAAYVAFYPRNRNYVISLIAYLWRIVICFLIQFFLIGWVGRNGDSSILGSLLFSLVLFIPPSYLFYLWGKGNLRRLMYRLFNKKEDVTS